jgi:hypothetical protein
VRVPPLTLFGGIRSAQPFLSLHPGAAAMSKLVLLGAVTLLAAPLGLPFENTWFAGFVAGVSCYGLFVSLTVSLREPDETSSPAYVSFFRFMHSQFRVGTAYFSHPSIWKFFGHRKQDPEQK